ncbi:colorectal mutant cancer protein-like isoform X2 [Mizuhopecten yessoensis]|uniref:colorectal mutant cancer protein-like isoform X2 n=1 Tax=Mizuhopecten yessoensis TaxID=6573 RepID=UPI000B458984|nr:colorectal mutant cancer protein-like isoform X2 [Mizuhopecten yessoensis]XP_021379487.1 colorectal mutant cancer protein-like isoform X2 [Mizuhopecten yessoensis]
MDKSRRPPLLNNCGRSYSAPLHLTNGQDFRRSVSMNDTIFKKAKEKDPQGRPPIISCRRTWMNEFNQMNRGSSDPILIKGTCGCTQSESRYLHLAAITSLKGELIELNNRFQFLTGERDSLEKQLNKSQTDRLYFQRDCEDRLEQTTSRYEERITELHSVIAELRKKIERHHINVIKEEEEYVEESDAAVHSNKSNNGGSTRDNIAGESQASIVEAGNDLNSELSRVVTELESTIDERKRIASVVVDDQEDVDLEEDTNETGEDDSIEEKALEACKQMEAFDFESTPPPAPPPRDPRPATFHPPPPPPPNEFPEPAYLQEEINSLRAETSTMQEQIGRQEAELNMYKAALDSIREERDRFKKKVKDIQCRQQTYDLASSPQHSRTATPTKPQHLTPSGDRSTPASSTNESFPVAKVAELKKLKTCASERQILGAEISSAGLPNTKVAEHLVQSLQECSNMQEILQTLYKCGNEMSDNKLNEFELEFERLQSKIDNLKSQNDLLLLTLEESKSMTDRLTVLMGKYESNHTALQLAVGYSDQTMEAYDVLLGLVESELAVVLCNCQAAGLTGQTDGTQRDASQMEVMAQRVAQSRRTAESMVAHLLLKLDRNVGIYSGAHASNTNPWEEMSSESSSKGSAAMESDFDKNDEQRIREYIQCLKNSRGTVKSTIIEMESIHLEPQIQENQRSVETQRLDLENAVLLQELMAMKEEKTELKSSNYLLEKEKRALELKLSSRDSEQQANFLQIEHLKCELQEREARLPKDEDNAGFSLVDYMSSNPDLGKELSEAAKREKKLKARVQELVVTLEKLSRNSEIRHQQSADFVNDLKRANSALISAFDKSKKKYQSKLKRMELQMAALTERYDAQIQMIGKKLAMQESETVMSQSRPAPNETSL